MTADGRRAGLRRLVLLVALLALALPAPRAFAHAVLLAADPVAGSRLSGPPGEVTLRFSEPVQVLAEGDLAVLDARGASVAAERGDPAGGSGTLARASLRPGLRDGTYTVRYRVLSADSHAVRGLHVFAVGPGPLGPPAVPAAAGPAETGGWGVSARFVELVALGGLAGLLAFRWLVWRPALGAVGVLGAEERARARAWGGDLFWSAFGVLALTAVLAEGYVLAVKGAGALGTSVGGALRDPLGLGVVLGETRFGGFVRARAALLLGVLALAGWGLRRELGARRAGAAGEGRPATAVAMAALLAGLLVTLSVQGHASQAPLPALSVTADALHLASVAVWVGGLALVAIVLWRLPSRLAGGAGAALASATLVRFSGVALVAVAAALVTGVARSVGQLADPAQLWETGYGLSIVVKLLLLCPLALLALMNRRAVAALRRAPRPGGRALRVLGRRAGVELALSLAVVVVASVLVAQVPGRV